MSGSQNEDSGRPDIGKTVLPEASFEHLIRRFTVEAMVYMGVFPMPQGEQPDINLDAARVSIDLIGIIEEKTRGNLTEAEKSFVENTLTSLRLQFVKVSNMPPKEKSGGEADEKPGEIDSADGDA